ncbi:MAG: hypothetical protein WAL83_14175 [Arenicellales bacterium]|jgi:hypothetical protein
MNIPRLPTQTRPVVWGAVAGAIVLAIVGFNWGGWVTTSTAEKLAARQSEAAIVSALTPICVDQFQKSADASTNLAALKEISNIWERRDYVAKGGWATMPGSATEPNRDLAGACAEELTSSTSS